MQLRDWLVGPRCYEGRRRHRRDVHVRVRQRCIVQLLLERGKVTLNERRLVRVLLPGNEIQNRLHLVVINGRLFTAGNVLNRGVVPLIRSLRR